MKPGKMANVMVNEAYFEVIILSAAGQTGGRFALAVGFAQKSFLKSSISSTLAFCEVPPSFSSRTSRKPWVARRLVGPHGDIANSDFERVLVNCCALQGPSSDDARSTRIW